MANSFHQPEKRIPIHDQLIGHVTHSVCMRDFHMNAIHNTQTKIEKIYKTAVYLWIYMLVRSLCLALLFLVVHCRFVYFFNQCDPVFSLLQSTTHRHIHIHRLRLVVCFIRWFDRFVWSNTHCSCSSACLVEICVSRRIHISF